MELICAVQNYHWGKKGEHSLVAKFAFANSKMELHGDKTFAEFWMGTHPNGPSVLKNIKTELLQHIKLHPQELGSKVVSKFGNQLPFLLKILSVEKPLSIQAHPTKSHAKQLFQSYPNIYKDDNHKPELAIALSQFEALCGFRPLSEIKYFLKNIIEFRDLIGSNVVDEFLKVPEESLEENTKLMKICFQNLMLCQKDVVSATLDKLLSRLETLKSNEREKYLLQLARRIHSLFPDDVGVFCIYWLNYLILSPGESIFLAPNEPHAYLYGDCLECMANSDNVIRAGLTPKYRDVSTLCEMLTYKNYQTSEILFHSVPEDEYCWLYSPPIDDFAVTKIVLPENHTYILKQRDSASILLVFKGKGEMNSQLLDFGKVFFIPAITEYVINSYGLVLYQAFCNV